MEKFIPEVGITSEIEPKETKSPIVETIENIIKHYDFISILDEDDEESDWIWFGVGGPA